MRIRDFVVLGRTVPEESKKYGKRICMAGFSAANNQFLRVYPLMVPVGVNADANGFRARHLYDLELLRNPNDSRSESWRVADERSPTRTPWKAAVEVAKTTIVESLVSRCVPSIAVLNDCKLSLGVLRVKAADWEGVCVPRESAVHEPTLPTLFDDLSDQITSTPEFHPDQIRFVPMIHFRDRDGFHKLQIREWGAYRLLIQSKYADDPKALWGASGYRTGKDLLLVVGNMMNHRTN